MLLAIQDYRLRHRQPGGFLRGIPPLTAMEALLFQMIGAGFILLSITLVSGLFFLEDLFAQHLVHKATLSFIAWGVFGVLLWGRWRFGWRGRTAIRWTLSGFVFLALAYFCLAFAGYALTFWMPTLIKDAGVSDIETIGYLTALPSLVAVLAMNACGFLSDRTGHRVRYIVVGGLERAVYAPAGLAKFDAWVDAGRARIAFRRGESTIYELAPAPVDGWPVF